MKTPLSSILLVLFASFVGSFGTVFLKAGADKLERTVRGRVDELAAAGWHLHLSDILCDVYGGSEVRRADDSLSDGLARLPMDADLVSADFQGAADAEQVYRHRHDPVWRR